MSLSKSRCWYLNSCLHFLKHAVPLLVTNGLTYSRNELILCNDIEQTAKTYNLNACKKSANKN